MKNLERIEAWESAIRAHSKLVSPVLCLQEVGSTMDVARELSPTNPNGCALALARRQTAGRGRQGRVWEQSQEGMYATFVLLTKSPASALVGFSLAVGCALRRVLRRLGADCALKWPNDLLSLDGRKLGGILIELVSQADTQRVLVGIGVNVRAAPKVEQPTAALEDLLGRSLVVCELAAAIASELLAVWELFLKSGFASFQAEWTSAAFGLGELIQVDSGQGAITGNFMGVNEQGCLLVDCAGKTISLAAGHVTKIGSSRRA